MRPYPAIVLKKLEDAFVALNFITRQRDTDITEYNNLPQRFMLGRKVGKVPSASNDVDPTDRLGDFNYDAGYFYILVDDSGAAWRRATLGAW